VLAVLVASSPERCAAERTEPPAGVHRNLGTVQIGSPRPSAEIHSRPGARAGVEAVEEGVLIKTGEALRLPHPHFLQALHGGGATCYLHHRSM
jgi:hypothetical protein